MKTAIVTSDTFENHLTGDGHPEQPKRVISIINILKKKERFIMGKTWCSSRENIKRYTYRRLY